MQLPSLSIQFLLTPLIAGLLILWVSLLCPCLLWRLQSFLHLFCKIPKTPTNVWLWAYMCFHQSMDKTSLVTIGVGTNLFRGDGQLRQHIHIWCCVKCPSQSAANFIVTTFLCVQEVDSRKPFLVVSEQNYTLPEYFPLAMSVCLNYKDWRNVFKQITDLWDS